VRSPPRIVRCNGTLQSGKRCRREAIECSVVCEIHGGLAPQVRRRAAERLTMTADQAAQMLVRMMEDWSHDSSLSFVAGRRAARRNRLTGQPLNTVLQDKVLGPLGTHQHDRPGSPVKTWTRRRSPSGTASCSLPNRSRP
jgi:hypothetical protein